MTKLIMYPILILGSESGPAKAEKGACTNWEGVLAEI